MVGSPLFILLVISTVFCSVDLFLGILETVFQRNVLVGTSQIPSVYSPEDKPVGDGIDTDVELVSTNPMLWLTGMTATNKSKYLESSIRELLKEREARDKELESLIKKYNQSNPQQL